VSSCSKTKVFKGLEQDLTLGISVLIDKDLSDI